MIHIASAATQPWPGVAFSPPSSAAHVASVETKHFTGPGLEFELEPALAPEPVVVGYVSDVDAQALQVESAPASQATEFAEPVFAAPAFQATATAEAVAAVVVRGPSGALSAADGSEEIASGDAFVAAEFQCDSER